MESIKQSTQGLGGAIGGFVMLVLLLLGIAGTLYKLLAPGGWILQAFGHSVSAGLTVLAGLGVIALLAWFTRDYSSSRSRTRLSDVVVYGFVAAGLVYAVRYGFTGVF